MKRSKKRVIDLEDERMGLFMTENSFELDVMYGRNFLQTDNAQKVKIYKIDIVKSKKHALYGQTKPEDRTFMPPITISVMVDVNDAEQKYYGDNPGGITRDDTGNISFGVYLKELEEKNIQIDRGDIVEYNMSGERSRFYEVESANNVTDTTAKTIGGFKPYWKKVTAVPARSDVVPFFNGGEKGE